MLAFSAVLLLAAACNCAIFNTDSRYGVWSKQNPSDTFVKIPYYIDASKYTATELANIATAVSNFNSGGIKACVQYVQKTSPTFVSGQDYVYINKTDNNGVSQTTCATVPGHQFTQAGQGQKLYLVGGTGGCTDDVRDIMRFLTIVACSMRNEYQRTDRTITVNTANIDPSLSAFGLYTVYAASKYTTCPTAPTFDTASITMVQPTKYGTLAGGTKATVWTGATATSTQQLSVSDCNCCAAKYSCTATCP